METVLEALKGINAYPVPLRTIQRIAEKRGIVLQDEATQEMQQSRGYNLAVADLLQWLSEAPNVSQGGQSCFTGRSVLYVFGWATHTAKKPCEQPVQRLRS